MRPGNLHNIEQKRQRLPIMLKMNSEGNECFVVGGGPRVGGKIEFAIVLL